MITNNLNINVNIQYQKAIWFILPLFPLFLIFFIGSVAETNRAPFDLAEAESELVSGFMTEHAGVIFVFFFLAEYASIILMCILTSALFIGGYLLSFDFLYYSDLINFTGTSIFNVEGLFSPQYYNIKNFLIDNSTKGLYYSLVLGLKSCTMIFIFI
jgi:NADH-ubiquinone oxidoreductase chain 1